MVDGEDHRVALPQWNHLRARLHARPLPGEHKLAASEVLAWLRQQDGDLERKGQLAIKVLVKTVIVARLILKEKRRRTKLAGRMAEF